MVSADCIAHHAKAPRYAVVMERIHHQGLFRPGGLAQRQHIISGIIRKRRRLGVHGEDVSYGR